MQSRIKSVTDKVRSVHAGQRPRVFYLIWHDPAWTAGSGTLENDLIETAGGVNIAHGYPGYGGITLDKVAQANPEVMIATFDLNLGLNANLLYQFLLTEPALEQTDARRDSRVYNMWNVVLSRPGPRIVDALEELAILIYLRPQGVGERI
jgi:iron complex transport system substrate-binding protein